MKKLVLSLTLAVCSLGLLCGCESTYYAAMEKVGQHKRDILVDRVENTTEAQQEAQTEFKDALTQLSTLINFDGKELAKQYELSKEHYDASKKAAENVTKRIEAIESVADALFEEWQEEINLYSNAKLKSQSQSQLIDTKQKYRSLLSSLRSAERKMFPVLSALQDNMLFLKHNLNASAINALQGEYQNIKRDVEALIADMNKSIAQSNKFVASLK